MDYEELAMWRTYYSESPFGYYWKDMREALNCKVSLAPHSKSDLSLSTFTTISTHLLEETEEPIEQLVHRTKSMVRGMAKVQYGKT